MPWAAGTQATQPGSPADLTPVVAGTQTANTSHLWNQAAITAFAGTASDLAHATDVATRLAAVARTGSDAAALADVVARLVALHRSGADTAGATDLATRAASSRSRTGSDTAPATDVAARSASTSARTGSDSAGATDVVARLVTPHRTGSDAAGATDVATGARLFARTGTDLAHATDVATKGSYRAAADNALASDVVARLVVLHRTGSDSAAATDVATRARLFAPTASDLAHATDVATRASAGRSRTGSDTALAADVAARLVVLHRTAADSAALTDVATRARQFAPTASDLAHATDVAARLAALYRTASDTALATDVALRGVFLAGVAHGVGGASGNLMRIKPLGGVAAGVGGGSGNLTYWIGLAGAAHGVGGATGALVIVRAPDNDPFANPTVLAGATGTVAIITVADTYQPGEPDPQIGTGSVWYIFTASGDGTLHVGTSQTPAPAWQTRVDVYTGPSIDALVSVALGDLTSDPQAGVPDSQTGGTDLMVSSGVTYRIRVQDAGQGRFDGVLDWVWAAVPVIPPAPNVTLESTTVSTYSVQINAANLTPGQVLTFNLLNATLVDLGLLSDTVTADDSGSVHAASVSIIPPTGPLPASGNYTLVAHAVPDVSLPLTLTLLEPDVPQPLPTAPSPVPTVAVQRWVFQDVTPGASVASWTVPLNPFDMTSPFGDKNISDEGTVSPEGQTLIFEGMTKPVDWSFTGWVLDETHYNDLEYWHARPYRVYIVDHYKRAWEVYIYSLDIKPVVGVNKPWKHQYTMKVRITRGPIQL